MQQDKFWICLDTDKILRYFCEIVNGNPILKGFLRKVFSFFIKIKHVSKCIFYYIVVFYAVIFLTILKYLYTITNLFFSNVLLKIDSLCVCREGGGFNMKILKFAGNISWLVGDWFICGKRPFLMLNDRFMLNNRFFNVKQPLFYD